MGNFELIVATCFSLVATLIFGMLTSIRSQLARIERNHTQLLTTFRGSRGETATHSHSDSDEPDIAEMLQAGASVPALLDSSADDDRWSLIVGLRPGCRTCKEIADALPRYVSLFADFRTVIFSSHVVSGFPSEVLQVRPADDALLQGSPFALLVAPDGTIEGNAHLGSALDLADFVSEGSAHGFGPGVTTQVSTDVAL